MANGIHRKKAWVPVNRNVELPQSSVTDPCQAGHACVTVSQRARHVCTQDLKAWFTGTRKCHPASNASILIPMKLR